MTAADKALKKVGSFSLYERPNYICFNVRGDKSFARVSHCHRVTSYKGNKIFPSRGALMHSSSTTKTTKVVDIVAEKQNGPVFLTYTRSCKLL